MIIVCGEALIDLFLGAPEGACLPARAVAGGSPFNVAVGLARLGAPAGFLGGISKDRFGSFLFELLAREGVDTTLVRRPERLSTISVVSTGPDGSPQYSFHGENAADRALTLADLPDRLPDAVVALTFGSYTMAVDPVGAAFLALARREKDRRVISVDPNVRPTLVGGDMAAWRDRFGGFLETATIVKASDEDVHTAYGRDARLDQVAAHWLEQGPVLAVITQGGNGATAFWKGGSLSVPGRAVTVQDTVGAGDTFHAALLARLLATGNLSRERIATLSRPVLADVMGYAITASSITCSRRGADLPSAADIRAAGPA
ncbi:MAG: carbohydrate kinase [Azospirillaceae bacterium]|nr:carbohydrate kinase [Azospirillaceae bacterium]